MTDGLAGRYGWAMQIKYGVFPYGSLEGTPTIKISESGEQWRALDLASILARAWRVGYRSIQLGDDVPWGERDWDKQLHGAMTHAEVGELEIVALRKIGEVRWSQLMLTWCIDGSSFLEKPIGVADLRAKAMNLPHTPRPAEAIVCNPAPENVTPKILDEFAEQLGPEFGCYLYADDDEKGDELDSRMRLAFPKLRSFWTVRRITRQHTVLDEISWEPQ